MGSHVQLVVNLWPLWLMSYITNDLYDLWPSTLMTLTKRVNWKPDSMNNSRSQPNIMIKKVCMFFSLAIAGGLSLESDSPQVSRILLSILANLNAVVWIVSILPQIFKCFNPLSKPMGTVPSTPTTIRHQYHVLQLFWFSSKVLVLVNVFTL